MRYLGGGYSHLAERPARQSNLELLRIVAMLFIIAHHLVVYRFDYNAINGPHSLAATVAVLYGAWGKTAINCFVLISGYFLCTQRLTWQKVVRLLLEIWFYYAVVGLVFVLVLDYPVRSWALSFLYPFEANKGFIPSFLWFYVGVPFYNRLIGAMDRRSHACLVLLLLSLFCGVGTLLNAGVFNEPFWYMTLFFVAAYVRFYPSKWMQSCKQSWLLFGICFALGLLSMLSLEQLIFYLGKRGSYLLLCYFLVDSHKLLAFAIAFTAFLAAKNSPSFVSRGVNTLAKGCFAVLLIHTYAHDVSPFWDWLSFNRLVLGPWWQMLAVMVLAPIVIYLVCASIDMVRQRFIEPPVLCLLDKIDARLKRQKAA